MHPTRPIKPSGDVHQRRPRSWAGGGSGLNRLHYKGYTGQVELDREAGTLFGTVAGLNDAVTFQGETVPELVRAFRDSVEDYLKFCASLGREPERPYSGRFDVQLNPALHQALAARALSQGKSLNDVVAEALGASVGRQPAATAPAIHRAMMAEIVQVLHLDS